MVIVNYYYLSQLLGPLNTLSEKDNGEILTLNPNDESAVRSVLRKAVKPKFDRLSPETKERCRNSFRYFLTTKRAPFEQLIVCHQESPLDSPDEPMNLFIWLWQELFPGEEFLIENPADWVVENDITKAVLIRVMT